MDATDLRRQLLPWRPRVRLLWFWQPGLNRLYRVMAANQRWFNRRARGWSAPLWIVAFFIVNYALVIVGVAVVAEVTIIPFAASIYAVFFEWLALILVCPFVMLWRFVLRKPWPTIPRHRSRRVIWP